MSTRLVSFMALRIAAVPAGLVKNARTSCDHSVNARMGRRMTRASAVAWPPLPPAAIVSAQMRPSPSLGPPWLSPSPSPAFGPCGMPPPAGGVRVRAAAVAAVAAACVVVVMRRRWGWRCRCVAVVCGGGGGGGVDWWVVVGAPERAPPRWRRPCVRQHGVAAWASAWPCASAWSSWWSTSWPGAAARARGLRGRSRGGRTAAGDWQARPGRRAGSPGYVDGSCAAPLRSGRSPKDACGLDCFPTILGRRALQRADRARAACARLPDREAVDDARSVPAVAQRAAAGV